MSVNTWMRGALAAFVVIITFASQSSLAQSMFREEFLPKSGKGPGVLIISGQTGPDSRRAYAKDVAAEGYYVLLLDGNDIHSRTKPGAQNFKDAVASMLASPSNTSNKIAVVGFSLGGGGVLAQAVHQTDTVSGVVAIYPATSWIQNVDGLANRINVPLLFIAAEKDTYNNCCLIEKAREIEAAAKSKNKNFEFVTYPDAEHGFDLTGRHYRRDYVTDSWKRTMEAIKKAHANTAK
jgi:dienelactone hydrolase